MKFKYIVGEFLRNRIALNFIATIILAVIEEITELEYTCAPPPWNLIYFTVLLVLPFLIFFILNFIIQMYMLNSFDVKKDDGCCRPWSCRLWQSSFPPCMWLVIVFLDGRYFQCAMSTDHDASIRLTNFEMSSISKTIGLVLLLVITLAMLAQYCYKNKNEPQQSNPGQNPSENIGNPQHITITEARISRRSSI